MPDPFNHRRTERRDGPEVFLADPDLFLVDGFSVNLGIGQKVGAPMETGPSFFITLTGRTNGETEHKELHVKIGAEHGWTMGNEMMTRLEEMIEQMRKLQAGEPL